MRYSRCNNRIAEAKSALMSVPRSSVNEQVFRVVERKTATLFDAAH